MYAVDAKYSILMRISAIGGAISSGGPSIVLEADVLEGPVRDRNLMTKNHDGISTKFRK